MVLTLGARAAVLTLSRAPELGLEHPTTVKLLNKFAEVLRDMGKMAEAEEMFYRVLAAEQKSTDDVGGGPRKGAAQAAWSKRVQEFFHPSSQPQLPEL